MQLLSLGRHWQKPISKVVLSLLVILYLLALNLIANQDVRGSLFYGVWPALLTLFILALISLLPHQFLKLVSIFFIGVTSVVTFFKYQYKTVLTDDIVLSAWTNDASLSLEMASTSLVLWLLLSALLPALCIALVPIKKTVISLQLLQAAAVCLVSAAGIYAIFSLQGLVIKSPGSIRDAKIANSISYFTPIDFLYAAREARKSQLSSKSQFLNISQLSQNYEYAIAEDMQDIFVLVIVGETARGDRFSLNSYSRNTNPQLAALNNLHSFSNVSSCDTITMRSLKCIFNRVIDKNPSKNYTESAFTEVFKSLGFKVNIFSLQGLTDFYRYLGYDQLVSKYAILKNSAVGAKDGALLPYLGAAVKEHKGRQLVVLHTLGSHHTYDDRLLETNKHFKPSCANADIKSCSTLELNNAYDNTIVATDAFIHDSIKLLENKKAVVLYVSDHGESLGDNGIYYHGAAPETAPKEQFSVPLIIWLSPALIRTPLGKKMEARLASLNKNESFSHDNFFHSVLGCSGISSSDGGLDDRLNLCAPRSSTRSTGVERY